MFLLICFQKFKMSSGGPSSSLVVPMVMWGPQAPTHCISALYLMRDQKTLVISELWNDEPFIEIDMVLPLGNWTLGFEMNQHFIKKSF